MDYLLKFLIISLLLTSSANAPGTPSSAEQINPTELPADWWNYFQAEGEELKSRVKRFYPLIDVIPANLSEDRRNQGQVLVTEIKSNLDSYVNVLSQPKTLKPTPSPFSEAYSIDQLIELSNRSQKSAIDLMARQEEREDILSQQKLLQRRLDKARQDYNALGVRSEEKTLSGLEILSLKTALENAKAKTELLNRTIDYENEVIRHLNEEITQAINNLTSTPAELAAIAGKIDQATRSWEELQKSRQRNESAITAQFIQDPTQNAEIQNDQLTLRIIELYMKETEALNLLLRSKILYQLSKLLVEPKDIDLEEFNRQIKEIDRSIAIGRQKTVDWINQIQRILNRNIELQSLGEKAPGTSSRLVADNISHAQSALLFIQALGKDFERTDFLLNILEEKSALLEGQKGRTIRIVLNVMYGWLAETKEKFEQTLFYIGSHPVTAIGVIKFLSIMLITWWLAGAFTQTLNSVTRKRKGIRKAVVYRLNRLIYYIILILGFLFALTTIGFDFSNLVLIAGALGVGLGFGLQNIFNNFISGIIILFQNQLKVGDFVEIDTGLRGEIREINFRSTVITTNDGIDVLVPNSELISNRIVNWTMRDPYRRVHIPFSVAYGSDIDEVARVVIEASKKVPGTLQKIGVPEPKVDLSKFGENALEMELVVWVNEKWTRRDRNTKSQYLWAIEKALSKNGFSIPLPQRDIHIRSDAKVQEKPSPKIIEPDK